jgi:hypothetical membrane protein
MDQRFRTANSLLAVCGMAAPILFALAVIVFGFLREGYSHISQAMSDLGEIRSPNLAGQNVNFILTGLLILAFSFGLYRGTSIARPRSPMRETARWSGRSSLS